MIRQWMSSLRGLQNECIIFVPPGACRVGSVVFGLRRLFWTGVPLQAFIWTLKLSNGWQAKTTHSGNTSPKQLLYKTQNSLQVFPNFTGTRPRSKICVRNERNTLFMYKQIGDE